MIENILKRLKDLTEKDRLSKLEHFDEDKIIIKFEDLESFKLNFVIEVGLEPQYDWNDYEQEYEVNSDLPKKIEVIFSVSLWYDLDEVVRVLDMTEEQTKELKHLIMDYEY